MKPVKTKIQIRKLALRRETIRALASHHLAQVAGGQPPFQLGDQETITWSTEVSYVTICAPQG